MSDKPEQFNNNAELQPEKDTTDQRPIEELGKKEISQEEKMKTEIADLRDKQLAEREIEESERKERESLAVKWAEQKRATDAVEFFLERQKPETPPEKPPEQVVPAKTTRRNFLRTMAIGVGLAIGGAGLYELGKEGVKRHKTAVERPKIIERTGVDLTEMAENCGFDIDLEVDNTDGPYILHIGQTHKNPNKMPDSHENEVINMQKNIEKFILALQNKRPISEVYDEGCSQTIVDSLVKERKRLKDMTPTPDNYSFLVDDLSRAGEHLEKQENNDWYRLSVYNSLSIISKIKEMEEYFFKNPPMFDAEKEKLEQKLIKEDPILRGVKTERERFEEAKRRMREIVRKGSILSDKDAVYVQGAVRKLFFEERIGIQPAEDKKISDRTVELMDRATDKDGDKFEMTDQVISAQAQRENFAVRSIATNNRRNNKLILLVYGRAHDFKRAVEAHNKAHPGEKLGLIRLTPKR